MISLYIVGAWLLWNAGENIRMEVVSSEHMSMRAKASVVAAVIGLVLLAVAEMPV